MTELWLGGGLLLVLASLFLLLPGIFLRRRARFDATASKRDWFAQRRAELAREGLDEASREMLLQDVRLRLLEDSEPLPAQPATAGAGLLRPAWLLLPLLLLVVAGYWQLGAAGDVRLLRSLQGFDPDSGEAQYRALMSQLEKRAAQRPHNLHYQAMLGRFYMDEADYVRASKLYLSLAEKAPNDATALAMAARAGYLAAGRVLDHNSQLLAERALSVDPQQRTALGLLGMAAYENRHYQAALGYWQRLLATQEPDSAAAQMIEGVISLARQSLGQAAVVAGGDRAAARSASVADGGAGVSIRLQLPPGATIAPAATVFLFARNPALQSRMPVAVQRLTVAQLPLTLRLDDARSMAGQKISELAEVRVIARVSPGGRPGAQHATWSGELAGLVPTVDGEVHTLVLQPVEGK